MKDVFVVDDDEGICSFLKQLFEKWGYNAITANSYSSSIEILNKGYDFELGIFDINLGEEKTGLDVIKEFKNKYNKNAIAFSSDSNISDIINAIDHGCCRYITKPVSINELSQTIKLARNNICENPENLEKNTIERIVSDYFDNGFYQQAINLAHDNYKDSENELSEKLLFETYIKKAKKDISNPLTGFHVLKKQDLEEIVSTSLTNFSKGSSGRHFVFSVPPKNPEYIIKMSISDRRLDTQYENLQWIDRLNELRKSQGISDEYIQTSKSIYFKNDTEKDDISAIVLELIPGENLYHKVKNKSFTYKEFEDALVQIARFNIEGLKYNQPLKEDTNIIKGRIKSALDNIKEFNKICLTDENQFLDSFKFIEDELSVMEKVYYFDCGLRNIISRPDGRVYIIDSEDSIKRFAGYGLISLLQYGGKYLSEFDINSLTNRYFVELQRAFYISDENKSVDERKKLASSFKLTSHFQNQKDLFKQFFNHLSLWKNFEWIGHKARFTYRSKTENSTKEYLINNAEQLNDLNLCLESCNKILYNETNIDNRKSLNLIIKKSKEILNEMIRFDFHTHTYYSDGDDSPEKLLHNAVQRGIYFLGVVDHDTTKGYSHMKRLINFIKEDETIIDNHFYESGLTKDTLDAVRKDNIKFIGGLELTTILKYDSLDLDCHLLGYDVDFAIEDHPVIKRHQRLRHKRSLESINLYAEQGIDLPFIEHHGPFLTRWHITHSVLDLFNKLDPQALEEYGFSDFLGKNNEERLKIIRDHTSSKGFAHIPYSSVSEDNQTFIETYDGADLLKEYNSKLVLAHPIQIYDSYLTKKGHPVDSDLSNPAGRKLLTELIYDLTTKHDLFGVEVYSSKHTEYKSSRLISIIKDIEKSTGKSLVKTFGSDYHGENIRPDIVLGLGSTIFSENLNTKKYEKKYNINLFDK